MFEIIAPYFLCGFVLLVPAVIFTVCLVQVPPLGFCGDHGPLGRHNFDAYCDSCMIRFSILFVVVWLLLGVIVYVLYH